MTNQAKVTDLLPIIVSITKAKDPEELVQLLVPVLGAIDSYVALRQAEALERFRGVLVDRVGEVDTEAARVAQVNFKREIEHYKAFA